MLRAPQHACDGLRGQMRDLPRISAVRRGVVEHDQYQLTEWDGLCGVVLHAFLETPIPAWCIHKVTGAARLHTHLEQIPDHQTVGNEFDDLRRR